MISTGRLTALILFAALSLFGQARQVENDVEFPLCFPCSGLDVSEFKYLRPTTFIHRVMPDKAELLTPTAISLEMEGDPIWAAEFASQPVVSVLDHGADSTGVKPVANYFAMALEALPKTGGSLYIPAGTYNCDTDYIHCLQITKPNVRVFGDGVGRTILRRSKRMKNGAIIYVPASRVVIEGITVDGNWRGEAMNNSQAEVWLQGQYITFENNEIKESGGHGFAVTGQHIRIAGNTMTGLNVKPGGWGGVWTPAFPPTVEDFTFERNVVTDHCLNAIDGSGSGIRIINNYIARNHMEAGDGACWVSVSHPGQIYPSGGGQLSVRANGTGNLVAFNVIEDGAGKGSSCMEVGVGLGDNEEGVTVIGNKCQNNPAWGIAVQSGKYHQIIGNQVLDHGRPEYGASGLLITGVGDGLQVIGNTFIDTRKVKYQAYGIYNSNPNLNGYIFMGNDLRYNTWGPIFDAAEKNKNAERQIFGNLPAWVNQK